MLYAKQTYFINILSHTRIQLRCLFVMSALTHQTKTHTKLQPFNKTYFTLHRYKATVYFSLVSLPVTCWTARY